MYRLLPDNATHVYGIKLSPWTADPNSPECSMRIIEGGDPTNVAHRVAFIEKTPRVRFQPFDNTLGDWKNWHQGWKGDDGWCEVAQGWCDTHLQVLGYVVPDAKSYADEMLD